MIVCADSSFLVSKYVADVHSLEADKLMSHGHDVTLTVLNRVEFVHVLHQLVFRTKITLSDARKAWADFEQDCREDLWTLIDLPNQTWETSIALARRHGPALGVRTLDSLHVASALEVGAVKFWTFDDRQARLAQAVGLDTNP